MTRVLDRKSCGGNDDEFDADAKGPVVTQEGEMIELGEHRLLCGDATKVRDVRRLMNGKRVTLFATDPPYLVGYDGTNHAVSKGGGVTRTRTGRAPTGMTPTRGHLL